jgi:hypothetical protein
MDPRHRKMAFTLNDLYLRWRDEREYEDFGTYRAYMQHMVHLEPDLQFVSLTQSPFKLQYRTTAGERRWAKATNRNLTWGSIQ